MSLLTINSNLIAKHGGFRPSLADAQEILHKLGVPRLQEALPQLPEEIMDAIYRLAHKTAFAPAISQLDRPSILDSRVGVEFNRDFVITNGQDGPSELFPEVDTDNVFQLDFHDQSGANSDYPCFCECLQAEDMELELIEYILKNFNQYWGSCEVAQAELAEHPLLESHRKALLSQKWKILGAEYL